MTVASVKENYDDLSCSIPISCLSSLNADFDGDVINLIRPIGTELKDAFSEIFDPHYGFLIDRNDGMFNTDFGLIKDEMIGLYQFCNI